VAKLHLQRRGVEAVHPAPDGNAAKSGQVGWAAGVGVWCKFRAVENAGVCWMQSGDKGRPGHVGKWRNRRAERGVRAALQQGGQHPSR